MEAFISPPDCCRSPGVVEMTVCYMTQVCPAVGQIVPHLTPEYFNIRKSLRLIQPSSTMVDSWDDMFVLMCLVFTRLEAEHHGPAVDLYVQSGLLHQSCGLFRSKPIVCLPSSFQRGETFSFLPDEPVFLQLYCYKP